MRPGNPSQYIPDKSYPACHLSNTAAASKTRLSDGAFVPGLQPGEGNTYYYGEPTADRWTPDRWKTQFDPNILLDPPSRAPTQILPLDTYASSVPTDDDGSVPLNSALNGSSTNPFVTVFANTVHSPGWTSLGFQGNTHGFSKPRYWFAAVPRNQKKRKAYT